MTEESRISVKDETDVVNARALSRNVALEIGFEEIALSEIEIAVTELASNLARHGKKDGQIIIKRLPGNEMKGIEIRAEDKGPGIRDIDSALRGGASTIGTLGIGLSGVRRLMDEFSVASETDRGTTVIARKWLSNDVFKGMSFSVLARPRRHEDVSGDAYFIKRTPFSVVFSVIDALGHGREAYEVSRKLLGVLEDTYREPLITIINVCHSEARHTRGAAMALCRVDFAKKKMEHISVGNVETRVYGAPVPVRPWCFNGTLGMAIETCRVIEYPYSEKCLVVMYSDGISGKFELSERQIVAGGPQEIASFIFSNYERGNDDATVLAGRQIP